MQDDIKELLEARLKVITTRLDAMDKAIAIVGEYPTEVDKAVSAMSAVFDERFKRFETMFGERDVEGDRRITALRESTALALSSVEKAAEISQKTAEKAVAKAEAAADRTLLEQMIAAVRSNFSEQILATRETLQAAMLSSEKAILKADAATERRFESVNEFRAQLNQQQQTFMPRQESETWHRSHVEKIDAVASRLDKIEGRSSGYAGSWAILVAAVGLVGTVVGTIIIVALNT